VGLTWRDLDMGRNMATVTEKGDKTRCVLYSETTRRALLRWRCLGVGSGRWVFSSLKTGERLQTTSVNRILERLKAKSGAEGPCNPHSFRHAFARNYVLAGGDLASLSELLGHSDVSVTKSFYARFLVEELREKHAELSPVNTLDLAAIVYEEASHVSAGS
jgi:integrase/recombinase XerD